MSDVVIVDDEPAISAWASRVLEQHGYVCRRAATAGQARGLLGADGHRLVLLDINLPDESGMDFLAEVREAHPGSAVVMITGEDSLELALQAIALGAYGYLIKPVLGGELVIAVANALKRRRDEQTNRRLLERFRGMVTERGDQLEQAVTELRMVEGEVRGAQAETIVRLARMVEFRDEETGAHVQRMSGYCAELASRLRIPDERCEMIRLASQLHDVGKIAVPDSVLLKAGRLTPEEFELMKSHAVVGYEMLFGSVSSVMRLAATIALTHHERWDGQGYPRGLEGEEIPLEGRIAAVADVFDALTSERPYRPAFPVTAATDTMRAERGSHFDPHLLDTFIEGLPGILAIREAHAT